MGLTFSVPTTQPVQGGASRLGTPMRSQPRGCKFCSSGSAAEEPLAEDILSEGDPEEPAWAQGSLGGLNPEESPRGKP